MIKKLFLIISIYINANACLCTEEITQIFNDIKIYVADENVIPTAQNISSVLIPQIKTNKQDIDKQNDVLEKLLKAEKLKALEAKKLVFLLQKLYNIESVE